MSTSPDLIFIDFLSDDEASQSNDCSRSIFSPKIISAESRKRKWSQYQDDQKTSHIPLHDKHETAGSDRNVQVLHASESFTNFDPTLEQTKNENFIGMSEHRDCCNSLYSLDDGLEVGGEFISRFSSHCPVAEITEGTLLGHSREFPSNSSSIQDSTLSSPRNLFPRDASSEKIEVDLIESADRCKEFQKLENTLSTDINSSNKCGCETKASSVFGSHITTLLSSPVSTATLFSISEQGQDKVSPTTCSSLPYHDMARSSHRHLEAKPYIDEEAGITGFLKDGNSSLLPAASSLCYPKNDNDVVVTAFRPGFNIQSFFGEVNDQKRAIRKGDLFTNQGQMEKKFPKKTITVELSNSELWSKFYEIGTEMIITKAGRRMFPSIKIDVKGLQPHAHYLMAVDVVPIDNNRYRYVYQSSKWMAAGTTDACLTPRTYIHPDSPAKGDVWMRRSINFDKMKLTNHEMDKKGHVILHSMHKYLPRIHIIECRENEPISFAKLVPRHRRVDEVIRDDVTTITFEECAFTTVTAYQNQQITKLKIDRNPFAKGFRDTNKQWRPRASCEKSVSVSHFGSDNWGTDALSPTSSCYVKPSISESQACPGCLTSEENDEGFQSVNFQSHEQPKLLTNSILSAYTKSVIPSTTQLRSSHSRNSFDSYPATSRSYFAMPYIVQPPRTDSDLLMLPNHYHENMGEATSEVNSFLEINSAPTVFNDYLPASVNPSHSKGVISPDQACLWPE